MNGMHQNNPNKKSNLSNDSSRKTLQGVFPRKKDSPSLDKVGIGGHKAPVHQENSVHNWHMGVGGGNISGTYYMGGQAIPDQVVDSIVEKHGVDYKNKLQNLSSNGHRLIVPDRERAAQIWFSGSRGPSVSDKPKIRGSGLPVAKRTEGDYLYYDTDLGAGNEALNKVTKNNAQDPRRPWDKASDTNVGKFKGPLNSSDENFNRVENLIPDKEFLQGFKKYQDPSENLTEEQVQSQFPYTEKDENGNDKRYGYRKDEMGWTHALAKKAVDLFHMLPKVHTLAALAKAGEVKRGWYKNYSELVRNLFGFNQNVKLTDLRNQAIAGDKNAENVFRFTGLLAATSPKVPVDENLNSTLHIWHNYQSFEKLRASKDTKSQKIVASLFSNAEQAIRNISPDLEPGSKKYNEQLQGYALMYFMDKEAASAYVNRKSSYKDIKLNQKRNTAIEQADYLNQIGFKSKEELDPTNPEHRDHFDKLEEIKDKHAQIYKNQEKGINEQLLKTNPVFSKRFNDLNKKYLDEGYSQDEAASLAERDTFNRFASKITVNSEDGNSTDHSVTGLSFGAWFSNAAAALYRDVNDVTEHEKHHLFYGDEDSGEGRKVESFRRNLLGYLDASTNDSWQSNIGNVPQKLMGDERYHAFTAKMRMVADYLTKTTGEKWHAAEVQETMWSFYRTLVNLIGSEDLTVEQALKTMTVGELQKTDDFVGLMKDAYSTGEKKNARQLKHLLEQAGIRKDTVAQFKPSLKTPHKYNDPTKRVWDTFSEDERRSVAEATGNAGIHATSGSVGPRREAALESFKKYLSEKFNIDFNKLSTPAIKEHKGEFSKLPDEEKSGYMRQAYPPERRQFAKALSILRRERPIRYAQFTPVNGGMQSAPVSQRTNVPFGNAVAKQGTGKNIAHAQLNDQIAQKAGIQTSSSTAIGDWPNGSEQSTVHTSNAQVDPAKMRYLAAWHGLSGQKKSVLIFHPNEKGPDSLYHINHPETDLGKLREQLNQFNLQYKTLVPGAKGTKIMLFDPNKSNRSSIDQFATKNNLGVVENTGQGEIIGHNGDWNSAGALPKSRQAYNNIIAQYEQNQNSSGSSNNSGGTPTPAKQASTGETKKQLSKSGKAYKFNKARRILEGFLRAHNTPNKELPPVGDLLAPDLQGIKPEHMSKYQQLVPGAKWSDIEGAVSSLQQDPSLYADMTSESNRREMYCKEHARTVLHSSGVQKLLDSLVNQKLIPEHAQHLIQDAKDGDYFALEAISAELQHSIPALRSFSKAAEREYNKAGKAWDKMRSGVQKFGKKHHSAGQFRAGEHEVIMRGATYKKGQFAPQNDGKARFEKGSSKLGAVYNSINKFRGS